MVLVASLTKYSKKSIDTPSTDNSFSMLECWYKNNSSKMVILKCIGPDRFYREKVVMPMETFCFEAPSEARLEIWQMSLGGQMLHLRADAADYAVDTYDKSLVA